MFRVALVGHGACSLAQARSAHVLWPKLGMGMSLGATEARSTCPSSAARAALATRSARAYEPARSPLHSRTARP
ncbi:hypothetical protein SAMN04487915_10838 [Arthrobacter sp. ov118]|nr:hypothetical protein SAMN04487915_10838 [Arthrobacter sp. ov118]